MSKRSVGERFIHTVGLIEISLAYLAGIVIYAMACAIILDIISTIFRVGIIGIYEFVELSVLPAAFLGIGWVQKRNKHIHVEAGLLVDRLPHRLRTVVNFLPLILSLFVLVLISYLMWLRMMQAYTLGEHTWGIAAIPYFPFLVAVVIGCFMMVIRLLIQLKEALLNHRMPGEEEA